MASLTIYPDAGTGATTVDGFIKQFYNDDSGVTWATIRGDAGTNVYNTLTDGVYCWIAADGVGRDDKWTELGRSIFTFDTSVIETGATVNSAILYLHGGGGKADGLSITPDINIYGANPASDNELVAGDFDSIASTAFCDTPVTYANWSINGFNVFALNAAGKAAIVVDGITKLGARNANYDVSGTAPNWVAGANSYLAGYYADEAGTDKDPKLVINYDYGPVTVSDTIVLADSETKQSTFSKTVASILNLKIVKSISAGLINTVISTLILKTIKTVAGPIWTKIAKSAKPTWTGNTKNTTTMTDQSKSSTPIWTEQDKS